MDIYEYFLIFHLGKPQSAVHLEVRILATPFLCFADLFRNYFCKQIVFRGDLGSYYFILQTGHS